MKTCDFCHGYGVMRKYPDGFFTDGRYWTPNIKPLDVPCELCKGTGKVR